MKFQYKQNHHFGQYRFETTESYCVEIPELAGQQFNIREKHYQLVTVGNRVFLRISKGYAWNGMGTSGLYLTTAKTARASCIHDTLYQCMREGLLPQSFRPIADNTFRRICKEDREWGWTVEIYYALIRTFGGGAAKQGKQVKGNVK